jgi:hypothetical protein
MCFLILSNNFFPSFLAIRQIQELLEHASLVPLFAPVKGRRREDRGCFPAM